ncbi:MAG: type I-E CRISPR-associated protein Cas6/Cse3/CasE [Rhodoferax sp.]
MKEFVLKKPVTVRGYPIHRTVAALARGSAHLWRDDGDTLIIRTAAPIGMPGADLPKVAEGELRLFKLRACVSRKVGGRHIYPPQGDHQVRHAWLGRQGLRHGFEVVVAHSVSEAARVADQSGRNFVLDATEFTGVLKVTDVKAFANALCVGVGSTGKAFGFSLLSI